MNRALELLRWQIEAGADEAIGDVPIDRFAAAPAVGPVEAPIPRAPPAAAPITPKAAVAPAIPRPAEMTARAIAAACGTLAELEAAVRGFEGCGLRRTATNTVFADGDPAGGLVVVGEAPGAEEDRLGKAFVGRSGQLLDRMLAAIGIDRSRAYIMNTLYWRPPGNRPPTDDEVAACLPFVQRQIVLARPRVVLLCGNAPLKTLLGQTGITRQRGRWFELSLEGVGHSLPALPTFHPSYLLRTPGEKQKAWRDLLAAKSKLEETEDEPE
jgi:uracil-DNA glycosylase family 4